MTGIFSFTGWSGNGKTTLLSKLIKSLSEAGYTASAVKQSHKKINIDKSGTDSYIFSHSGADEVCLLSENSTTLFLNKKPVNKELLLKYFPDADIILCEGVKSDSIPCFEVAAEINTLKELKNTPDILTGIITESPSLKKESGFVPDYINLR